VQKCRWVCNHINQSAAVSLLQSASASTDQTPQFHCWCSCWIGTWILWRIDRCRRFADGSGPQRCRWSVLCIDYPECCCMLLMSSICWLIRTVDAAADWSGLINALIDPDCWFPCCCFAAAVSADAISVYWSKSSAPLLMIMLLLLLLINPVLLLLILLLWIRWNMKTMTNQSYSESIDRQCRRSVLCCQSQQSEKNKSITPLKNRVVALTLCVITAALIAIRSICP